MCSLCITSITNINARLSAGEKGGGQEYVCSLSVHMCRCKCVYLVCVYACSCIRIVRQDSMRIRSDKRVDVIHATRRRKCILSLGTINTEASKLGGGWGGERGGMVGERIFWLGYILAGRLNVLLMPHS